MSQVFRDAVSIEAGMGPTGAAAPPSLTLISAAMESKRDCVPKS